jgi:hypothetical protein
MSQRNDDISDSHTAPIFCTRDEELSEPSREQRQLILVVDQPELAIPVITALGNRC